MNQVDILGHSLGTMVMYGYLAYPGPVAKVGYYVNIVGLTGTWPPGGVDTLALWAARGTPGRDTGGCVEHSDS